MGLMKRRSTRRLAGALPAAAFALAACSQSDLSQIKIPKVDTGTLATPNFNEFQKREDARSQIGSADLVDASGRCADSGQAPKPDVAAGGLGGEGANPTAPPTAQPVALKMTECEVVRAIGPPQDVLVGSNERGDRAVRLEFKSGSHPGIYHFVAGRLVSMERINEPTPPPATKPPPKKPKQAT
jgi:hypothetical protein